MKSLLLKKPGKSVMNYKKYTIIPFILLMVIFFPVNFNAQEEGADAKNQEASEEQNPAEQVEEKKEEESPQDKELRRTLSVLEKRKKDLDEKEDRLNEKEKRLNALKADIETKLESLNTLDQKVKQALFNLKKEKEAAELQLIMEQEQKYKDLAKLYENMKAKKAASIVNNMAIPVAQKMFPYMRPQVAGEILANVNPAKAAEISKALTEKEELIKK